MAFHICVQGAYQQTYTAPLYSLQADNVIVTVQSSNSQRKRLAQRNIQGDLSMAANVQDLAKRVIFLFPNLPLTFFISPFPLPSFTSPLYPSFPFPIFPCILPVPSSSLFPFYAPCRLWGCKNRPTPFLVGCRIRRLNQALSISLSVVSLCVCSFVLFIMAAFCIPLVCISMCSVFWLFWISCHYLPSDWLERLPWGGLSWPGDHLHKAQTEGCINSHKWKKRSERRKHCALASCGTVYCYRSCLFVCLQRVGGRCPHLTTASTLAVFASLWALFHLWLFRFSVLFHCYTAR